MYLQASSKTDVTSAIVSSSNGILILLNAVIRTLGWYRFGHLGQDIMLYEDLTQGAKPTIAISYVSVSLLPRRLSCFLDGGTNSLIQLAYGIPSGSRSVGNCPLAVIISDQVIDAAI